MASKYDDFIGNNVSVGTGIKVFFRFRGEYLNTQDRNLKENGIAIEIGILNDITYSTNRDVAPNYLPGNRNPLSFTSGKRLTSGRISFAVMGRDFMDYVLNVLLEDELVADKLEPGKVFDISANRFGARQDPVDADDTPSLYFKDRNLQYLDQLPPVDIFIIGRGDNIHTMTGGTNTDRSIFDVDVDFRMGTYYKLELNQVKFLNDNFGFSAGAPVQDQILDFIAIGDKVNWVEVPTTN